MTLKDIEGAQVRLIGPKQEKGMMRGYVGKTEEHIGAVVNGEVVVDANPGLYDVSYRKTVKSPWLSSPDLREHRCP